MNKIFTLMACVVLSSCAINPWTAPPATCEAIFAEMGIHNDRIARAVRLGDARDATVVVGGALVAAQALNPLWALAGTFLTALDINTVGNEKRRELLWRTATERECW